jgi:hypothetical protein
MAILAGVTIALAAAGIAYSSIPDTTGSSTAATRRTKDSSE